MSLEKKWLRDLLIPVDYWRYLFWRLLRMNQQITLTLQNQQKIILRASDSLLSDRAVAREVFLCEAYQRPNEFPQRPPQFIVDIGANVGYSIIYLAYEYPNATFAAFEPHPQHLVLLEQNLRINRLLDKVNIEKIAVSNCNTEMFLTDTECLSTLVDTGGDDCISVQVCDFFTWVGNQTIDLLKMDIEGGEYAILNDIRFATVDVRTIVMEWHNTKEVPTGYQWCSERLRFLGYKITEGKVKYENAGILWAWKD